MNQDLGFFKTTMPETRKADFHLGCREGAVFLDFNFTINERIRLVRISFDGYGCCNIQDKTKELDDELSKEFITQTKNEKINQGKMTIPVKKLIQINKDEIWSDALDEYNLI